MLIRLGSAAEINDGARTRRNSLCFSEDCTPPARTCGEPHYSFVVLSRECLYLCCCDVLGPAGAAHKLPSMRGSWKVPLPDLPTPTLASPSLQAFLPLLWLHLPPAYLLRLHLADPQHASLETCALGTEHALSVEILYDNPT